MQLNLSQCQDDDSLFTSRKSEEACINAQLDRLISDEIFIAVIFTYVSNEPIIAWELSAQTVPCRYLDYHKSKQIYESHTFH